MIERIKNIFKKITEGLSTEGITRFSTMDKKNRKTGIAISVLSFFLSTFLILLGIGKFGHFLIKQRSVIYWMTRPPLIIFSMLIGSLITFAVFNVLVRKPLNSQIECDDDSGLFQHSTKKTSGSSNWLTPDERRKIFDVGKIEDVKDVVYGKEKDYSVVNGEEVVGFKYAKDVATANKNTLIVGAPGSGKTYTIGLNNVLQAFRRGDSLVITDPKGEIYTKTSLLAKQMGYEVEVLNTADPEYSNYWNCLNETINAETERLDPTRLSEFAKIYIENSGGLKDEEFWKNNSINLLSIGISFVAWKREKFILERYNELYRKISGHEFENIYTVRSFKWYREQINDVARVKMYDQEKIDEIYKEILDKAPEYTLGKVYDALLNFETTETLYEGDTTIPDDYPGKNNFTIFKGITSSSVRESALIGVKLKLNILSDIKLKKALSKDSLNIRDINKKKTAVYVIMTSGANAPAKPITSLFFSFFFKDEIEEFNKYHNIEQETGQKNPCCPVLVMLDEFASIGVIGGDPKAFADTMSIVRSSRLDVQIIIQNISQLISMYEKENANGIISCCATRLSLGVNDLDSAKFFSDLTGVATVMTDRHREATTAINADSYLSDTSLSGTRRQLLTPDEVMTFTNKVLIIRQGQHPTSCLPYPHTKNPLFKEMKSQSVYSSIEPIKVYEEVKVVSEDNRKASIKKSIENLRSLNYNLEQIEEENGDEVEEIIEIEPTELFEVDIKPKKEVKKETKESTKKKKKKTSPEVKPKPNINNFGGRRNEPEPCVLEDEDD